MLFSNTVITIPDDLNLIIGQWGIPRVDHTKLLGLIIDQKLKFDLHTKQVASKISKTCGILYLIRKKLNAVAMKTIYMSLIYPSLIYCVPIWGGTWATHLRPVITAQKRAVRVIAGVRRYEHTHHLFMQLKLLKFHFIFTYFTALLMFKHLNYGYVESAFSMPNHQYNI